MHSFICITLFALFEHRICCGHIPDWIARRHWESIDVPPWNLYNIIWSVRHWVRGGVS